VGIAKSVQVFPVIFDMMGSVADWMHLPLYGWPVEAATHG